VPGPEYRFLEEWLVPQPIEAVSDLMADVHGYPAWWGDVWVSTDGHAGPPSPGTRVNKRGVRQLTPVLRPLFRSNHAWAMQRGQKRIVERLERP
jgi:hypothetical protein